MEELDAIDIDRLWVTKRSASEQLSLLGMNREQFKGKTVLVLGPGRDFDLEKALSDAGATLVVALSASFEKHARDQDPEAVSAERPVIWPVKAYFQALPPMDQTFDLVVSVYGFPLYAYDAEDTKLVQNVDAELRERFSALIDLLKPGGEARLTPVIPREFVALAKLQEEQPGVFEFESEPSGFWISEPDTPMEMAIIRKNS